MKLIITRHGETIENTEGIIQGHLPGHLTCQGIDQAQKLALRLKEEKIDFIYSSDLDRAKNTNKEIIKYHPNVPIEFTTELRERYLGEWQGKNKTDLGFCDPKNQTMEPNDAETREELFKRANEFLNKIILKHPKNTVLLVAHGGINKAMIATITSKKPEDIKNMEFLKNTSVCIFKIDNKGKVKTEVFNCSKHLD